MRQKIVAGNWKMNKTLDEANILASEIKGMVADEAYRIECFIGWAGSNKSIFSAKGVGSVKKLVEIRNDFFGFGHAPTSNKSAGKFAEAGFNDLIACLF